MKNKMYNKIQITYCSGVGKGIVKEGLIFNNQQAIKINCNRFTLHAQLVQVFR